MGNLFEVLIIRQTEQKIKELTKMKNDIINMIRFTTFFGDIIKTPLNIGKEMLSKDDKFHFIKTQAKLESTSEDMHQRLEVI